ncbi:MAG: FAD-binding oxidoreductase [Parasphingorhabdus sp.]
MFTFDGSQTASYSDDLPDEVDVVIIGGGIIGISTAWHLLKAGKKVLVCEKGRIACEQSSRNWGWVRVTGRDPDEVPIALDSVRNWQEISKEIGEDIGFRQKGMIALVETAKEMAGLEKWMDIASSHQMDSYLVNAEQAQELAPTANGKWKGGIATPSDGRAEPFLAVPAIAKAAKAKGAYIAEDCAVRVIEKTADSISAVVTERGTVRSSAVVCAAGAWTNIFLSNLGVDLPQLVVKGTVVRTAATSACIEGAAGFGELYARKRTDGGFTLATGQTEHTVGPNSLRYALKFLPSLGSTSDLKIALGNDVTQHAMLRQRWSGDKPTIFEKHRVLNPKPSAAGLKKIRQQLKQKMPQLGDVTFEESWAGMIDATPDVVPVMDAIPSIGGLFVATGFSGHGFGIGPGAGKVMAQLVLGEKPPYDLTRFRFGRFSDGSKINPGPAI